MISELYDKHGKELIRFCEAKTNNHDADEIAQSTWEKLLTKGIPEHHANLKAYVFSVAKTLIIDRQRRKKRLKKILTFVLPLLKSHPNNSILNSLITEQQYEKELKRLKDCLNKLKEPDQTIVEDKMKNIRQKVTAKKFKKSVPWVSNRAKAAVQKVTECVQKRGATE